MTYRCSDCRKLITAISRLAGTHCPLCDEGVLFLTTVTEARLRESERAR